MSARLTPEDLGRWEQNIPATLGPAQPETRLIAEVRTSWAERDELQEKLDAYEHDAQMYEKFGGVEEDLRVRLDLAAKFAELLERSTATANEAFRRAVVAEESLQEIFKQLRALRDKEEHDSRVYQDIEMILGVFDSTYPLATAKKEETGT